MKFFRLDLLTLLISLFILNSCKNQDTIGLGVTASTQINGTLIDTSTIIVNTVPEDTVVSSGLPATPLAYFKDPVYGITQSDVITNLNLPGATDENNQAYILPTGTISIDSALLILPYVPGYTSFYGDSITSKYKANVYQLNERLYSILTYPNTRKWQYNSSNLLGSATFLARPTDSVSVLEPITGRGDSLEKKQPQIRIPITPSFINTALFNSGFNQLASNLIFQNNVKGLYITLDQNQPGPGGALMLNLDSAALKVYFKTFDGSVYDTLTTSMPVTLHAAYIKHTYSQTIQTELNNTNTSRNVIYLQGTAGLRVKISFPYLKNILKTVGSDIVVNRAQLVVTASPGSTIPFAPLPRLTIYRYDLANQRIEVQDASTTDPRSFPPTIFGGFYNPVPQQYTFNMTAYIQDLIRGVTTDTGTFIGPIATTNASTLDIAATAQIAGRTIAIGTDKTSPYQIKLNIIYTKIAK